MTSPLQIMTFSQLIMTFPQLIMTFSQLILIFSQLILTLRFVTDQICTQIRDSQNENDILNQNGILGFKTRLSKRDFGNQNVILARTTQCSFLCNHKSEMQKVRTPRIEPKTPHFQN